MTEDEAMDAVGVVWPETTVDISIESRTGVEPATRADQARTVAQVAGCESCETGGVQGLRIGRSTPELPEHARFVVVMPDAAARTRKLLEVSLRNAKVGGGDIAWVARVACGTIEDGPADSPKLVHRTPSRDEKERCYGNTHDSIWAANTDFVLLVGAAGKDLWRPDLTMGQVAGVPGVLWDRYVAMVVDNPANIDHAKGGGKKQLARRLVGQLEFWGEVVKDRRGRVVTDHWGPRLPVTARMARACVECGDREVVWVDRDALGWCREHRNDRWMAARGLSPNAGVQERML